MARTVDIALSRGLKSLLASVAALYALMAMSPSLHAAEPWRLQSYSLGMAEGLANNVVYCMLQDDSGFIWLGTFGGLSRYDGVGFSTYRPKPGQAGSLASSTVFALLQDRRGYIWVGTDGGGLSRYDAATNSFRTYRARAGEAGALGSDRVLALAEDPAGGIWAATGDGAIHLWEPATDSFRRFGDLPSGGALVRCLLVEPSGRLWAGTEGGGLLVGDKGGSFSVYRSDARKSGARAGVFRAGVEGARAGTSIGSDVVRSLLRDSKGRIWIGLGNGGVDRFDGSLFEHAFAASGALPSDAVRALGEDRDGTIWIGWADSGLGALDPSTLRVQAPSPADRGMVRSIIRDRGGLMWVGYKEGGARIFNLRAALFERFLALEDGTPLRSLRGMAQDREGRIYAGSDGDGLLSMDPRGRVLRAVPGLPEDPASRKVYAVLAARDGSLWIGTDGGGLIRRDSEGRVASYKHDKGNPASIASDVVWTLFEDEDRSLWIGMEGGGLDLLRPGAEAFEHQDAARYGKASIVGVSVRSILRDREGRLWVGTWEGGLSRLDPGGAGFRSYGTESTNPSSLGDAGVNCIFEDSGGGIWIGTGGAGLAKLDPTTERFMYYGESEGLASDSVVGILEDRAGELWIATSNGLSRFSLLSGSFFSFGAEDGLASSELSQNSFLAAQSGELLFGGPGGLTRFRPEALAGRPAVPEVLITDLELAGSGEKALRAEGGEAVVLGFRNPGLHFHISVLDYAAPARNRYAMRIVGMKTGWTELGRINTGYIAPLAPGRYVLQVRGSNGNGVFNEKDAQVSILVEPPFWGTWWFRSAAIAAGALLLGASIYARTAALKKRNALLVEFSRHIEAAREEERTGAAREVHDEIGQHLAALNIQAYWLKTHPDSDPDQLTGHASEMIHWIGQAMNAVKSVATGLRPVALDALRLEEALSWYTRDFERRSGIRARISIGPDIPHVEAALATALFRVLQEALTNVLRHAQASSVELSLAREGEALILSLADDGIGIPKGRAEARDSFGIIGMRERCAAFSGDFSIGGGEGTGTKISVRVPLASPSGERPKKGRISV